MKIVKGIFLAAVVVLMSPMAANAGSITTTFEGGNGFNGNMFDLTTFGNALTVTGFDLNVSAGPAAIEVYLKAGTYVGSESTAADWMLVGSGNVSGAGLGFATFFDTADFLLNANTLYGLYVTTTGASMQYTNGTNTYTNADLQLDLGVGKGYPFASTFTPRTWNGTIYYDVAGISDPSPVSEPGTLALLVLGLAGMAARRKKTV